MPKILERLRKQIEAKGYKKDAAYAIATKALQRSGNLKPGTNKATKKGIKRGNMTAEARAKDRASKRSKHKSSEYSYSKKTNRTRLKRGKK